MENLINLFYEWNDWLSVLKEGATYIEILKQTPDILRSIAGSLAVRQILLSCSNMKLKHKFY
jgi:hypothetical protein